MIFDEDCFSQVLDAAYDALDGKANSQNRDMATTMTFVCFHQGGCMMAHIGIVAFTKFVQDKESSIGRRTTL